MEPKKLSTNEKSTSIVGMLPMNLAESVNRNNDRSNIIFCKCPYAFVPKLITAIFICLIGGIIVFTITSMLKDEEKIPDEIIVVTGSRGSPNITLEENDIELFLQIKNKTSNPVLERKKRKVDVEKESKNIEIFNDDDIKKVRKIIMEYPVSCEIGNENEFCKGLVEKVKSVKVKKDINVRNENKNESFVTQIPNDKDVAVTVEALKGGRNSEKNVLSPDMKETIPHYNSYAPEAGMVLDENPRMLNSYYYQPGNTVEHGYNVPIHNHDTCLLSKLLKQHYPTVQDYFSQQPVFEAVPAPSYLYAAPNVDYLAYDPKPFVYGQPEFFGPQYESFPLPAPFYSGPSPQNRESSEFQDSKPHDQDVGIALRYKTSEAPSENRSSAGSKECHSGSSPCANGQACISDTQWCNGKVDCMDASDELRCGCKARVDKWRHCDGYYDCPFGEDEMGCFGCNENSFSCDNTDLNGHSTCFSKEQRCDNVYNCPNGKDETECNILSPTLHEKPQFPVSTTEGFLQRNFRGDWYSVCMNPYTWAHEACERESGLIIRPPSIHMAPVDPTLKITYLNKGLEDFVFKSETCMNSTAVYVTCPSLLCGTRVQPTPELLRQSADFELFGRDKRFERDNYYMPVERFKRFSMSDMGTWEKNERKNNKDKRMDSRVVGGNPSEPAAWPFVVAIYKDGMFHCGGVILDQRWVMSAAHCVHQFWDFHYEIKVGMLRRFSFSPQQQTVQVTHIIVNKFYDGKDMKNDLSLLRVKPKMMYSRWVRPICLPRIETAGNSWSWGPPPGTLCTAVGWGSTVEHGPDPDHLREVEVPIWEKCNHRADLLGNEICAGFVEGGKDTCQGDSGGPLLCRNPFNMQQWYVAGVVSHGSGCARKGEPGVYTRVSLFTNWINHHLSSRKLPTLQPKQECPGFRCVSGVTSCIHKNKVCDKIVDCLDAEDEINCDSIRNNFRAPDPAINLNISSDLAELFMIKKESDIDPATRLENVVPNNNNNYKSTEIPSSEKLNRIEENVLNNGKSSPDIELSVANKKEVSGLPLDENQALDQNISIDNADEKLTSKSVSKEKYFAAHGGKKLPDSDIPTNLSISMNNLPKNKSLVTTENGKNYISIQDESAFSETNDTQDEMQTFEIKSEDKSLNGNITETAMTPDVVVEPVKFNLTQQQTNIHIAQDNKTIGTENITTQTKEEPEGSSRRVIFITKDKIEDDKAIKDLVSSTTHVLVTAVTPKVEMTPEIASTEPSNFNATQISQLENKELGQDLPTAQDPEKIEAFPHITLIHEKSLENKQFPVNQSVNINRKVLTNHIGHQVAFVPAKQIKKQHIPGIFNCQRIMQTIPYQLRCDHKADCEDGTDEHGCTCVDFLTTFNEKLLCDGVIDCADGSDEISCSECDDEHFLCKWGQTCIPMKHVCDNTIECPTGEDELGCYALSNGRNMTVDIEGKPKVHLEGFLTKRNGKNWDVVCEDNLSNIKQEESANHICRYLGFSGANRFVVKYINIKEKKLMKSSDVSGTRKRRETTAVPIQFTYRSDNVEDPRHIVINEPEVLKEQCVPNITKICMTLYVYCEPILFTDFSQFDILQDIQFLRSSDGDKSISKAMHTSWPWTAKVYFEGEYRCAGILIDPFWVLAAQDCLWNTFITKHYVTAVLGSVRTLNAGHGPHEQSIWVDYKKDLYNIKVTLLHLARPASYSGLVKPMVIPAYGAEAKEDICVAVGQDPQNNTINVFLKEMEPCEPEKLCYLRQSKEAICTPGVESKQPWYGIIACHTTEGWTPRATFVEHRGECGLTNKLLASDMGRLKSEVKPYLGKSLSDSTEPVTTTCDGIRCGRGRCVPLNKTCDGVRDCEDGSDETNTACEMKRNKCSADPYQGACECASGQLKCKSGGRCIPKELFGDGRDDCGDGSDEPPKLICSQYLARSAPSKLCDGLLHCADRSDEDPAFCKCFAKQSHKCGSLDACVATDSVCDGIRDCPNGDDERLCLGLKSPEGAPYGTGEVIMRSHGVWHSKCYSTTNHTRSELESICIQLGFISGHAKQLPPPASETLLTKVVIGTFTDVILNNNTNIKLRNSDEPFARTVPEKNPECYPVYIECI